MAQWGSVNDFDGSYSNGTNLVIRKGKVSSCCGEGMSNVEEGIIWKKSSQWSVLS